MAVAGTLNGVDGRPSPHSCTDVATEHLCMLSFGTAAPAVVAAVVVTVPVA